MRASALLSTVLSIAVAVAGFGAAPASAQQMQFGYSPGTFGTLNGVPYGREGGYGRGGYDGYSYPGYTAQPPRPPRDGYYSPYGSNPSDGLTGDWYVRGKKGEAIKQASAMPPPDRPKPRSGAEWGCMQDAGGWRDCDWYYSGRDNSTFIALSTLAVVLGAAVVLQNNSKRHRYAY